MEPRLTLSAVATIGANFTGSQFAQSGFTPPDTMGAVGPNHIVELINGRYAVYDKSGTLQKSSTLDQFWKDASVTPGNFSFDPRVVYDKYSGRWFASSLDNAFLANNILVAVSTSSDPRDPWRGFKIDSDPSNARWADFEMLGLNQEVVVVSANMFDISGDAVVNNVTESVLVLPKSDLLAATPTVANRTLLENVVSSDVGFSVQPAFDQDNNGLPLRLLSAANKAAGSLTTFEIGGSSTAPTFEAVPDGITVTARSTPPTIDQPGSKANIDAGDSRFSGNIIQQQIPGRDNPSLWGAHGVNISGRAAIEWYEIDAVTNGLLQSGIISDSQLAFNYPSIAVNDFGDVVIGFSGGSPATFMSTYVSVGQTIDGVTTFGTPVQTKAGTADYQRLGGSRNRWGDYSATVVDPSNESRFWTFQEFAPTPNRWAIQITEILAPLTPRLSIGDVTVTEGNTGTLNAVFGVELSRVSDQTVKVEWNTASDTAVSPADYWAGGGLLTFLPGELTKTITVAVKGDVLDEEDNEKFYVNLSSAENALISDGQGAGTIIDNDDPPIVALNSTPIQIAEAGGVGTVVATLSKVSGRAVTVNLKFTGTATLTSDYTRSATSITIAAGSTSGSMTLTAVQDTVDKFNEAIVVTIDTVTNGTKNADPSKLSVTATILNDEDFRFYVVDNLVDDLFGYATQGTQLSRSDLVAAATDARGITTNVDGSKLWVLDNNKTVYVLDSNGQSLGSWSAAQLRQPTGIATNGTDIWIVDKGMDTVYRFNNAASVTSGALTASSSFKLAPSNAIPEGISTDGTKIWVVNAGVPDRVFVYNLAGTLLGNWAIDPTNVSPTGITIDPTGAKQSIWIVDISKDRVYEYANARSWTSGNRKASSSFALAPGNTSPQDIVDPDGSLRRSSAGMSAGGDASPTVAVEVSYAQTSTLLARTRPSDAVGKRRHAVAQSEASQRVFAALDQAGAGRGRVIDKREWARDECWEDLLATDSLFAKNCGDLLVEL